jgi:hypothetical protein
MGGAAGFGHGARLGLGSKMPEESEVWEDWPQRGGGRKARFLVQLNCNNKGPASFSLPSPDRAVIGAAVDFRFPITGARFRKQKPPGRCIRPAGGVLSGGIAPHSLIGCYHTGAQRSRSYAH